MYIKHLQNNLSYLIVEHYTKDQFSESGTVKIENMSLKYYFIIKKCYKFQNSFLLIVSNR